MLKRSSLLLACFSLAALMAPSASASAWKIACNTPATHCEMSSSVTGPGSNAPLAEIALFDAKGIGPIIEQRLPTGLHIPSGVVSDIDGAAPIRSTLILCDARFCLARLTATQAIVDQMKKGHSLVTRIVDPRSAKAVDLRFSLKGFTKTLNELSGVAQR